MKFVRGTPAQIAMWHEDMADSRANLVIEDMIPSPNDDAFFAMMLDEGVPLLLFPEGTRSRTGDMAPFKPGAAALCVSRDVPCVPVAIVGAAQAMPRDTGWPVSGRPPVYVTFGEPLRPDDGETVMEFSDRIAKEVGGLVDYTTTYRERHPHVRSRRRSAES